MKVFGIVGWKNSGKTGLMERLVAEITGRGFTVSTIKHAHHSFDVDQPGKDSYRHRYAGAHEVLLSSRHRWALMHENRDGIEATLTQLIERIEPVDLLLTEGFKGAGHDKIEANRAENGRGFLFRDDPSVLALASDAPPPEAGIPTFDLDDTAAIADFILRHCGLDRGRKAGGGARKGLGDDCFALPPGVEWIPVDTALADLRGRLARVVGAETVPVAAAAGRVLAADVTAVRANPPAANSAVDGYALSAGALADGALRLPLAEGRSAAGAPHGGPVPAGHALRILTGALLPEGADTVVLQEEVTVEDGHLVLPGAPRRGANVRPEGEDVPAGGPVLAAGRRLAPQDLALLTAVGIAEVAVCRRLRVAVLSTGDEIAPPAPGAPAEITFDANRPMLLSMIDRWGFEPVDIGHVGDDRDGLAQRLDSAAGRADAILTSGGASAGDEDHLSALLKEAGALNLWRIAIKPGRPLALGQWQGRPVFGLPGNPVAAFVCTVLFARPALAAMAGQGWQEPRGFDLPAAFEKRKKPGRREYLRARVNAEGAVEVFRSEGSGRISGLSWADGLVELADGAQDIRPGSPVRYYPFASFGL